MAKTMFGDEAPEQQTTMFGDAASKRKISSGTTMFGDVDEKMRQANPQMNNAELLYQASNEG